MSNEKHHESRALGKALRTLAERECHALQDALQVKKQRQVQIHRVRKSCRRLRCLVGFISPKSETIVSLDKGFQQLLHGFANVRDAHIAKRTARVLAQAHEAKLSLALLETLHLHSDELLSEALANDPDWRRRRSHVDHLIVKLQTLPWQEISSSHVKGILKRGALRVKKARHHALRDRTPETFHRWRRRARKLRYELELVVKARKRAGMKTARSQRYAKRARKLSTVTDRLGWRQDFHMFLQTLDGLSDVSVDAAALSHSLKRNATDLAANTTIEAQAMGLAKAYIPQPID